MVGYTHILAHQLARVDLNLESPTAALLEHNMMSDIDRNADHVLGTNMVRHKTEIAIGWHKRKHLLGLPSAEANARMEGDIIKQIWIHKRQTQVRHARKFDTAIDLHSRLNQY